jgi:acetoin utilization protein AcuB
MTPFPYAIDVDDSLLRARELMVAFEVRHLPVLKDHRLLGILTDRDLKRALDPDLGLPPKAELFVRDVYVPDPYVVDDLTPLDEVLAHMAEHQLGSVLVTKHGRLAGIFTSVDACRAYSVHLRASYRPRTGADAA